MHGLLWGRLGLGWMMTTRGVKRFVAQACRRIEAVEGMLVRGKCGSDFRWEKAKDLFGGVPYQRVMIRIDHLEPKTLIETMSCLVCISESMDRCRQQTHRGPSASVYRSASLPALTTSLP